MTLPVSDLQLKILVATWSQASVVQFDRIRKGTERFARNANGDEKPAHTMSYQTHFDTVFLLEALNQLSGVLETARTQFELKNPLINKILEFAPTIRDLRNMNVHQVDYLRGEGRSQARFVANTPFGHSANTFQVSNGQWVIGGRLNASACIDRVSALGAQADPRTGAIWR